jgi:hypothetical protein
MKLNRFKQLLESTMGDVKPLVNEDEDYIPKYNQSEINEFEKESGYAIRFYPGQAGGHSFTIADRVDVQRMKNHLKENNIYGLVVYGPDYHTGGSGKEAKSMSVLLRNGPDLEVNKKKVYDIIDRSSSFRLSYPHFY